MQNQLTFPTPDELANLYPKKRAKRIQSIYSKLSVNAGTPINIPLPCIGVAKNADADNYPMHLLFHSGYFYEHITARFIEQSGWKVSEVPCRHSNDFCLSIEPDKEETGVTHLYKDDSSFGPGPADKKNKKMSDGLQGIFQDTKPLELSEYAKRIEEALSKATDAQLKNELQRREEHKKMLADNAKKELQSKLKSAVTLLVQNGYKVNEPEPGFYKHS